MARMAYQFAQENQKNQKLIESLKKEMNKIQEENLELNQTVSRLKFETKKKDEEISLVHEKMKEQ